MNGLDVLILVGVVGAAVGGFRLGFVARSTSWAGMAVGLVIAAIALPRVLERFHGGDEQLLLLALVVLFAGAFLGQMVGLVIGRQLSMGIETGKGQAFDRGAGAIAGMIGVFVLLWLLLPTAASVPGWPARQARTSSLAGWVHDTLPEAPDAFLALRQLVGDDRFPEVFDALTPAPEVGPPPAETGISAEVSARIVPSTVKVEGEACGRIQDGTGFVVGEELVVTNAHVVAGEDRTEVERSDGSRVGATVVAFDARRDLAVLRVPGLDRPPLAVAGAGRGDVGGVYGHPGGGPLEISPYEIAQEVQARGTDIYDRERTERSVYFLATELAPGDSGSALINADGDVVGVAFAIAPDQPGVGYALTDDELRAVLAADLGAEVDTGPCIA
jgi:S1-C subfamily serine protease